VDFLTFITSTPIRDISSTAVLVAAVWLIFTGRLVPRRHYEDVIAERDAWRDAHRVSEDARANLNRENFKLLETARISDRFYRDFLPPVGKSETPEEGDSE